MPTKRTYLISLLVILLGILLFLLSSFVGDVRRLHRNSFYRLQHRPATLSDVGLVAPWMTFNYLNKSFDIPSDYFKTELSISDAKYPNLTLSKAAQEQGMVAGSYLETVKTEISSYLAQPH